MEIIIMGSLLTELKINQEFNIENPYSIFSSLIKYIERKDIFNECFAFLSFEMPKKATLKFPYKKRCLIIDWNYNRFSIFTGSAEEVNDFDTFSKLANDNIVHIFNIESVIDKKINEILGGTQFED